MSLSTEIPCGHVWSMRPGFSRVMCFPKLRNDALSQYAMTMRDIRLKVADALPAAVLQDPPPRPIYGEPMHADITSTCIPSQSSQDDASYKFPGIVGNACLSCAQCFTPNTPCRRDRFRVPRSKQNPKQCRVDSLPAQRCLLLFAPGPPKQSFDWPRLPRSKNSPRLTFRFPPAPCPSRFAARGPLRPPLPPCRVARVG